MHVTVFFSVSLFVALLQALEASNVGSHCPKEHDDSPIGLGKTWKSLMETEDNFMIKHHVRRNIMIHP